MESEAYKHEASKVQDLNNQESSLENRAQIHESEAWNCEAQKYKSKAWKYKNPKDFSQRLIKQGICNCMYLVFETSRLVTK